MDIYQVLRKDHQKVRELLDTLQSTTDRSSQKRERLFSELKKDLEIHSRLEEELFYARLKGKSEARHRTLEALEEHLLVTNLINEMDKLPHDTEEWSAKLSVLKENVNHHIREEENTLFKIARTILKEDEAEEIGNTFAYKKEEQMAVM